MDAGFLFCATNDSYLQQARLSAESIKLRNTKIKCALCTSISEKNKIWDDIIIIEKSNAGKDQFVIDKLKSLMLTPYNRTLFLDADTYVLDDVIELFAILDHFDLALCHGHERVYRYNLQMGVESFDSSYRKVISEKIPYAFSVLQSGVILYNKNKKTEHWLSKLLNIYQEKNFFDDQVSMRELLWESDVKFYILPPEYNFNSIRDYMYWKLNPRIANPKIFHYTKHKNQDIKKLIFAADRKIRWLRVLKKIINKIR
ncbi:MAG: hypothetical protein JXJ22_06635 [Bacteroidales bacterium]|nr:hypothetical protein [Bacteroidales bacterium]